MKRNFLILAAALFLPLMLMAQTVEVTAFGGYVFPGTWNGSEGQIYIRGNAQYGGQVSIGVSRVMDVDLIYNRSDTKAEGSLYNTIYSKDVPISANYMQVGFTKNFRINPIVSPYVGMNLGACLMYPKEGQYNEAWFFSVGINGGAKIYFSKRVGLKLQAQAYVPVQGAGFGFYYGGGGGGSTVSLYSTLVQFGFTGGLVFRLGRIQ